MRTLKRLLVHLVLMVLVAGVVGGLVYFYLFEATRHGEALETPVFKGLSLEEAEAMARTHGVVLVVHDSVFHPESKGMVLEQVPPPGALVKQGRKIYVVVSKRIPGKTAFPDVVDMPVEQAIRVLSARYLYVDSVIYVPDISQNIVLKAIHNGRELKAGDSLEQLSRIVLVVSQGLDEEKAPIPDVRGLPLKEAELVLVVHGFQLGNALIEESGGDTAALVVSRQEPAASDSALYPRGYLVDLWLTDSSEYTSGFLNDVPDE